MILSGWGNFPKIDSSLTSLYPKKPFITSGNFRSYGDAALFENVYSNLKNNRLISFDDSTGLLTCESGILLSEILDLFVPKGWFLNVSPGTKFVTIGGALSSDVHGKNHHKYGCFSESVLSFKILLPNGEIKKCTRQKNSDFFHATIGGMGLTGLITEVSFYLKKINSVWIKEKIIKTENLSETFEVFEEHSSSEYSVAWIDCLAKDKNIGKSIIMLGEFDNDGDLNYKIKKSIPIPKKFPSFILNSLSIKIFNKMYYHKNFSSMSVSRISIEKFFYPLDTLKNWNRIYGKNGFIQFQFILPKDFSYPVLTNILKEISKKSLGSFLAVLKLYGPSNKNWLSFPIEGYSLAMDFKIQPKLFKFICELTDLVVKNGGRVYLAKDALMNLNQFNDSYPNADLFREFRIDNKLNLFYNSIQSKRLNL